MVWNWKIEVFFPAQRSSKIFNSVFNFLFSISTISFLKIQNIFRQVYTRTLSTLAVRTSQYHCSNNDRNRARRLLNEHASKWCVVCPSFSFQRTFWFMLEITRWLKEKEKKTGRKRECHCTWHTAKRFTEYHSANMNCPNEDGNNKPVKWQTWKTHGRTAIFGSANLVIKYK